MKKQYIVEAGDTTVNVRHVSAVSKKIINRERYCMVYLQNGRVMKLPDEYGGTLSAFERAISAMAHGY